MLLEVEYLSFNHEKTTEALQQARLGVVICPPLRDGRIP